MGIFFPNPLTPQEIAVGVESKLGWILEACHPKAVIVFGSAARGTMTDRSDVDLALIFDDVDSLRRARNDLFRRPPPDDRSQDLLFLTEADFLRKASVGGVCEIIQAEGTALYGTMP